MDVGQGRQAGDFADFSENRQGVLQADAARGGGAGAVRLVEAGLVDDADVQSLADFLQPMRRLQRVLAAFHLAGAGDEDDTAAAADHYGLLEASGQFDDGVGTVHGGAFGCLNR
ncbi:hypothetical protein D3C72_854120 [compost metagenome]